MEWAMDTNQQVTREKSLLVDHQPYTVEDNLSLGVNRIDAEQGP
jgi:hypothetical protein